MSETFNEVIFNEAMQREAALVAGRPPAIGEVDITAVAHLLAEPTDATEVCLPQWSVEVLDTGNPVGEKSIAVLARLIDSEEDAHRIAEESSRSEEWRGYLVAPLCGNLLPAVAYQDGRRLLGGWTPAMTLPAPGEEA